MWKELRSYWKQSQTNKIAKEEYNGMIDMITVKHGLARIDTKLTARMDALEMYVGDVMEKHLKKTDMRERRAREKEEPMIVEPMNGFETIRQKYGGRE